MYTNVTPVLSVGPSRAVATFTPALSGASAHSHEDSKLAAGALGELAEPPRSERKKKQIRAHSIANRSALSFFDFT